MPSWPSQRQHEFLGSSSWGAPGEHIFWNPTAFRNWSPRPWALSGHWRHGPKRTGRTPKDISSHKSREARNIQCHSVHPSGQAQRTQRCTGGMQQSSSGKGALYQAAMCYQREMWGFKDDYTGLLFKPVCSLKQRSYCLVSTFLCSLIFYFILFYFIFYCEVMSQNLCSLISTPEKPLFSLERALLMSSLISIKTIWLPQKCIKKDI